MGKNIKTQTSGSGQVACRLPQIKNRLLRHYMGPSLSGGKRLALLCFLGEQPYLTFFLLFLYKSNFWPQTHDSLECW